MHKAFDPCARGSKAETEGNAPGPDVRRELRRGSEPSAKGRGILFYSDGLVEAHNPNREMFGSPRLHRLILEYDEGGSLGDVLLEELYSFTGEGWEQEEDDITLPTLGSSATRLGAIEEKWRLDPQL